MSTGYIHVGKTSFQPPLYWQKELNCLHSQWKGEGGRGRKSCLYVLHTHTHTHCTHTRDWSQTLCGIHIYNHSMYSYKKATDVRYNYLVSGSETEIQWLSSACMMEVQSSVIMSGSGRQAKLRFRRMGHFSSTDSLNLIITQHQTVCLDNDRRTWRKISVGRSEIITYFFSSQNIIEIFRFGNPRFGQEFYWHQDRYWLEMTVPNSEIVMRAHQFPIVTTID